MKEEWQNPDSGYLNCIGVGDTYVKKQMERILNESVIEMESLGYNIEYGKPIWVCFNDLEFRKR